MEQINDLKKDWKTQPYLYVSGGKGNFSKLTELTTQEADDNFRGNFIKYDLVTYIPVLMRNKMKVGGVYTFTEEEWEQIEIISQELKSFTK